MAKSDRGTGAVCGFLYPSEVVMTNNNAQQAGGITILGLGPGDAAHLTRQAWDWLQGCKELYCRTRLHPVIAGLPKGIEIYSFDTLYDQGASFEDVYARIVSQVLFLGQRPEGVTYAVPGHPYVAEATSPEIVRQAHALGLPVRVIEGLSFLEPTFSALQIDPYPTLALVDALTLTNAHTPSFPPDSPTLIAQIYSAMVAAEVKLTLMAVYPDQHPVRLVHAAGTPEEKVEDLVLYEIDRSPYLGLLSSLYLPPLGLNTSFEAFHEIIAQLRAPDGCPWDREQTHLSLRKHLLEETYEALDALDQEDMPGLAEELGDILLQIGLHAQIAFEEGDFNLYDVVKGINAKLIRRHPHVFGDWKVDGVSKVLQNWEKLKEAERQANGKPGVKGLLDGLPKALPALAQAQEIQDRAARVGFDWDSIEPVWGKLMEELEEVRQAGTPETRSAELGDLLFAMVNLVRWYKADAETLLRATSQRFRTRFSYVEKRAREQGVILSEMSLAEMDSLWEEAKSVE
jgi:tetrapyrrole methylase family protein / MazG family protein